MAKSQITIGNAGGYWGDDPQALERQVAGGRLDYITMDFLAEITMSIMQKQRSRDPNSGYAHDFLPMLQRVLAPLLAQKTKIITNAGGINPMALARAIHDLAASLGLSPRIAVVCGDDILPDISRLQSGGAAFQNMETGEAFAPVQSRILAANVYFGALPVAEALKWDPDIVVTGRVTDTGITLAPMIHEFGWSLRDWDKLAAGIIAGHMMECGAQVTGGNFTDWRKVPSFDRIGYPYVEMDANASFVITKHPGSGGLVSVDTVREQLFYEMGQPEAYLTPDVVADFSSIELAPAGPDRVMVKGIRGYEPTPFYKVSMAYGDGFKANGMTVISGPDARQKAETFAEIFWKRIGNLIPPAERETEYFGWNACHGALGHASDGHEILLRLGVRSATKSAIATFGKLIPSLILSGPPGVSVYGGVPKAQEVVSYWPALLTKESVQPKIALVLAGQVKEERVLSEFISGNYQSTPGRVQTATVATQSLAPILARQKAPGLHPLSSICLGRSGDKGDTANIGILARSPKAYAFIVEMLSAQVVKDLFQELCHGKVLRYEVPKLNGLNFLLESSLGGGGTKTLRIDAQGKTFAQALLRQCFAIPPEVLADV